MTPRQILTNALCFWERGRILYNFVLAAIVLGYFFANWPASANQISWDLAQIIFLMAILANVAYCAAYAPDLFAQLSGYQALWLKCRWILFVVGLGFAAILTRFFASGMFAHP